MRELTAYLSSALLHGSVLGGLLIWQSCYPEFSFTVQSGQSVSTITLTASQPAENQDTQEVETKIVTELEPVSMEMTQVTTPVNEPDSEALEATAVTQVSQVQPVKQQLPVEQPRETASPPPPKTNRTFSIASTAISFQAATDLGVEVDELPLKLATNAPPSYPLEALLAKIEGRVVLLARVQSNGTVSGAKIDTSSGNSALDQAALAAVLQWRFEPARRGGLPVEYEVLVPVSFSIRKS